MLNTAATRMYWKHETKNRAEFSKLVASSLSPTVGVSVVGGLYLFTSYYIISKNPNERRTIPAFEPRRMPRIAQHLL